MSSRNRVFVEVDEAGNVIRVVKHRSWSVPDERLRELPRSVAVGAIRDQVFKRAQGECENCGKPITKNTMQMHEKVPKGKGGEVSLANCAALCHNCHQGRPDSEHGNRRLRFNE